MPQTIHRGIKSLIDEANAAIETVSAADAIKAAQDPNVVIVDIRDPREIEREGKIPGAFSCTRGMLEFWIDPQSPYAKPIFQEDKKFIFHCAGGLRSALAAKTAQDMGLKPGVLPLPKDDYLAAHIPGAVFFDVDAVSDHSNPLPHMFPSAEQFGRDVGGLGIDNDDTVVLYDSGGWVAAPRVWWMFLSFGKDVRLLNGGLKKWVAEGRKVEKGEVTPKPATFRATFDARRTRSMQQLV